MYIHAWPCIYQYIHVHRGVYSCKISIIFCQHPAHKLLLEHCCIHHSIYKVCIQVYTMYMSICLEYIITWQQQSHVYTRIYLLNNVCRDSRFPSKCAGFFLKPSHFSANYRNWGNRIILPDKIPLWTAVRHWAIKCCHRRDWRLAPTIQYLFKRRLFSWRPLTGPYPWAGQHSR